MQLLHNKRIYLGFVPDSWGGGPKPWHFPIDRSIMVGLASLC